MNHRLSSRYFIRFDRLILVHVAAHYYIFLRDDLVHGAMVSNFCSSVASPPFFSSSFSFPRLISPYFFAYRPPLFFLYFIFIFFFIHIAALLCGKDDRISLRRACCAIEADARRCHRLREA